MRRAGAAVLGAVVLILWLMALPGLLRRDGLLAPDGGCRYGAYRDPVTGRPVLLTQVRIAGAALGIESCLPTFQGVRK